MIQNQIRALLKYDPNDPDWKWTSAFVECVPDKDVFEALFPVAIREQSSGEAVLAAAIVLRRRHPHCPLSCVDAVRALLEEWDVNVEEVPFYLVEQFGGETVRESLAEIERQALSEPHLARLKAVEYWIGIHEGRMEWRSRSKPKVADGPNGDSALAQAS